MLQITLSTSWKEVKKLIKDDLRYSKYSSSDRVSTYFIIFKVMKYRKILIKYNAYLKKAVFHGRENIKKVVFHSHENISCISWVKLDVLCFLH